MDNTSKRYKICSVYLNYFYISPETFVVTLVYTSSILFEIGQDLMDDFLPGCLRFAHDRSWTNSNCRLLRKQSSEEDSYIKENEKQDPLSRERWYTICPIQYSNKMVHQPITRKSLKNG